VILRRRRFIAGALAASALRPVAVRAAARTYRIGWVVANPQEFAQPLLAAFREGLRDLGYVEGSNLVLDIRDGNGSTDRIPEMVHELAGVDVIMTLSIATRPVVQNAGATPVVFVFSADPI
jgi:putative ABC transport system substrate-binding protein